MKRFLTSTALTIALAAPAFAMNSQIEPLRADVENMLDDTIYEVQVNELSDEQIRALYAALSATDSAAEENAVVKSIVNDDQFVMADDMFDTEELGGANEIRDAVKRLLDGEAIDADVDAMSNAQVSALYIELTSGDGTDAAQIEAIING